MKHLRVEQLSTKFSIVKDHLWCVYDGEQPLFQGSARECRDWLDLHEALRLHQEQSTADQTAVRSLSIWDRVVRGLFRS
ncbi:MAG: hypothetical protein JSS49_18985 [Planctomycetes bacterium]|nr:hypothetical protein [Planctomycetota bacterium]